MQISPALILKLETFGTIFVSSFLITIGQQITHITAGTFSWSAIIALITSAAGIALQAVYNSFIQSALGNQLKGLSSTTLRRMKTM